MVKTIIIIQILFIWYIGYYLYKKLYRRDNRVPIDDPGFIWVLVMMIYGTLPPIFWLLQNGEYTPLNGRLFILQPESIVTFNLLNIVIAYISGFACIYIMLNARVKHPKHQIVDKISQPLFLTAIIIIGASFVFHLITNNTLDIPNSSSRLEGYQIANQLPLGIRQLNKLIDIITPASIIIVTISLFQRLPKTRWWLFCFITFSILNLRFGGRSETALQLFTMVLCWHTLVKPIAPLKLLMGGIISIIVFMIIGVLRSIGSDGIIFSGLGEFDALWANAIELYHAKNNNEIPLMPFTTRYNDFWAAIPSQLLWFEKNSPSIWYLDNFYPAYKEAGGGFAFGAISEAVYGYGIVEGLLKGFIFGLICIKFMHWVRQNGIWWKYIIQVYFVIMVYQCVRDTSFRFIVDISQNILPGMIIIVLVHNLLLGPVSENNSLTKPST